jgi:AraC-like DNA-binding protein
MMSQSSALAAPGGYLADLERSGLRVRQWDVDETGLAVRPDQAVNAHCVRYTSWSDGDVGLFVTDTAASALTLVNADVTCDFVAIGLAFGAANPAAVALEMSDIGSATSNDIWIQFFPAGSYVRLKATRAGLKTVTLFLKASTLHDWARPTLPRALSTALEGQQVLVQLSVQIERERDDLLAAAPDLPHASLFYRAKSSMLLWLLLDHLRRCDEDARSGRAISDRVRARLELVRRSIDEAPEQRMNVDELARRAGLNRTSLRALFKQAYGLTLSDYRTTELMQRAERMLRKDHLSVAETAYALGYSDASSFSVAYKRHFGYPPGHGRMNSR